MFLKTCAEFDEIITTFTDQDGRPLEIEDKVSLTLFIKVNKAVYIAKRTYQFCWQFATILIWKTWSSFLNQLNR